MVPASLPVRTVSRPQCYVCGTEGDVLYRDLMDVIYGVQGEWTLRHCNNARCSLVWLDPMPTVDELPKLYAQYYTHEIKPNHSVSSQSKAVDKARVAYWANKYGYPVPGDFWGSMLSYIVYLLPTYRAQWDFGVFCLDAKPGGRLLEIGCGDGATLHRMSELGWDTEGVDFDPKAVEIARNRGLRVFAGTLEERGFAPDSFDAIVMSHVIEHVPDPLALLEKCGKLLRPGGRLISVTPNASSWGHEKFGRFWRGLEPPRHLHIFTIGSMKLLTKAAGFDHYEVSSVVPNAHVILWASRRLKLGLDAGPQNYVLTSDKLWSRLMQATELLRVQRRPESGEEICLVAFKPADLGAQSA